MCLDSSENNKQRAGHCHMHTVCLPGLSVYTNTTMPAISWLYSPIFFFCTMRHVYLIKWQCHGWVRTCLLTLFVLIMHSVGWIKSSLIELPCEELSRSALVLALAAAAVAASAAAVAAVGARWPLFAEGPMCSVCVRAQAPFQSCKLCAVKDEAG